MPRELSLQTREWGTLKLYLIYEVGGELEAEWADVTGAEMLARVPRVSHEVMEGAYRGYTLPLVKALDLAPDLAPRKLPVLARTCSKQKGCPLHDAKVCTALSRKMPTCYHPGGLVGENAGWLGQSVIRLWHQGVYVLVVKEALDAAGL